MDRFDAIVIGTGGMGAAALMHLADRGCRVCGLDRFPPAHDQGSSHGHTRLIRMAYFEHADYVPLLQRSYRLWRDLEGVTGGQLLVECGLLVAGPPDGDVIDGTLRSAATHGLRVERLTAVEAENRWPEIRIPRDWAVVHEGCGGYLRVEACVRAHAAVARARGARIEHGIAVLRWHVVGGDGPSGHVVVETDRGLFAADRLVITAGAWADDLLMLPQIPLQVLRKSLFWFAPREPRKRAAFETGRLPCFGFDRPEGFFYGFPSVDGRGVKIAEHTGGRALTDPLAVDRNIDPAERARVERALAEHLPGAQGPVAAHATCLYTMSPDGHFVLGTHPRHREVVVAAGFSGHGFKFSSVIGEILADLTVTGRTSQPIGFLTPNRFS